MYILNMELINPHLNWAEYPTSRSVSALCSQSLIGSLNASSKIEYEEVSSRLESEILKINSTLARLLEFADIAWNEQKKAELIREYGSYIENLNKALNKIKNS